MRAQQFRHESPVDFLAVADHLVAQIALPIRAGGRDVLSTRSAPRRRLRHLRRGNPSRPDTGAAGAMAFAIRSHGSDRSRPAAGWSSTRLPKRPGRRRGVDPGSTSSRSVWRTATIPRARAATGRGRPAHPPNTPRAALRAAGAIPGLPPRPVPARRAFGPRDGHQQAPPFPAADLFTDHRSTANRAIPGQRPMENHRQLEPYRLAALDCLRGCGPSIAPASAARCAAGWSMPAGPPGRTAAAGRLPALRPPAAPAGIAR